MTDEQLNKLMAKEEIGVVYKVRHTGTDDDYRSRFGMHPLDSDFEWSESRGLWDLYEYISKALQFKGYHGLIEELNNLQSYGNMDGQHYAWGEDKRWTSKGNIPYQIVNYIIKPHGLIIRRDTIKDGKYY